MSTLETTAPAFVEMAHRIVWCVAASASPTGEPRTRVLHPLWEWDGENLVGWVATGPTPLKRAHLDTNPAMSFTYWTPNQDNCTADCKVEWILDDEGRSDLWNRFTATPEPVGYDPSMIPVWESPTVPAFAGLRLTPHRLRVMPGTLMTGGGGELLTWSAD